MVHCSIVTDHWEGTCTCPHSRQAPSGLCLTSAVLLSSRNSLPLEPSSASYVTSSTSLKEARKRGSFPSIWYWISQLGPTEIVQVRGVARSSCSSSTSTVHMFDSAHGVLILLTPRAQLWNCSTSIAECLESKLKNWNTQPSMVRLSYCWKALSTIDRRFFLRTELSRVFLKNFSRPMSRLWEQTYGTVVSLLSEVCTLHAGKLSAHAHIMYVGMRTTQFARILMWQWVLHNRPYSALYLCMCTCTAFQ